MESDFIIDLESVPDGWFLFTLRNQHTPIRFAGDKHHQYRKEARWLVELQFKDGGGLLTSHEAPTPREALAGAIEKVRARA